MGGPLLALAIGGGGGGGPEDANGGAGGGSVVGGGGGGGGHAAEGTAGGPAGREIVFVGGFDDDTMLDVDFFALSGTAATGTGLLFTCNWP